MFVLRDCSLAAWAECWHCRCGWRGSRGRESPPWPRQSDPGVPRRGRRGSGDRCLDPARKREFVTDVEVVERGLQHKRLDLVCDSLNAAGGGEHQLVHLPPGHVVADGDRGGQGHWLADLPAGKAVVHHRAADHRGVGDAHQFVARGLQPSHQQGAVLHHPHHAVDLHPVTLAEGAGVDQHQAADDVGGHGTGAEGRQHAHEQSAPWNTLLPEPGM